MAAKPKRSYECGECGARFPQWSGQCLECGAWNSLQETRLEAAGAGTGGNRFQNWSGEQSLRWLNEVGGDAEKRTPTGIDELDRVLGGGLVPGSVTLLGGDPGIGKSTLLLQAMATLTPQLSGLYVTGEESLQQVGLRARRLGLGETRLQLLAETSVEKLLQAADAVKPGVMVVDSIQTIYSEQLQSAPGAVAQVRESAARIVRFAKSTGTAVLLVGHVTKEGQLAGPRVLEHMVDTVLYFEGDSGSRYRLIRAVKNRFGAVNELGVFAMLEQGLKGVSNPSALFLSRHSAPVAGSAVLVAREGTRPLLVEVQALVDDSPLGNPRRVTLGLEQNRLSMLLAVLHRHAGVALFSQDIFANVVGGVRVGETAADLPLLAAVISSFRDRPLADDLVLFGEIGLAGEVRAVPNGEERLREAAKHGFRKALVPAANLPRRKGPAGIETIGLERLSELLDHL